MYFFSHISPIFNREDTVNAGESALVFKHGPDAGEKYVITRDLDVGPMSVLQFDVSEQNTAHYHPSLC